MYVLADAFPDLIASNYTEAEVSCSVSSFQCSVDQLDDSIDGDCVFFTRTSCCESSTSGQLEIVGVSKNYKFGARD